MKNKPIYKDDRYIYKSFIELYFSYYLNELKEAGFIEEWWYETDTFELSDPVKKSYLKKLKNKEVIAEENWLQSSSITADFKIKWMYTAINIFVLLPKFAVTSVRAIPFRQSQIDYEDTVLPYLFSWVETKGNIESSTSSSISFPYKQKWCYQKYGVYIQKIKPLQLFQDTFTPNKVLELEKYVRDCKFGTKGSSKLHYTPRTLEEYLKYRGYENKNN